MSSCSQHSELTIQDLPDSTLERVFVLAGKEFCPAIVSVSRRWWRVCWGSRQLWRSITISQQDVHRRPITDVATSHRPHRLDNYQALSQRWQARASKWQAAQRALLERVGHMAEAVTVDTRSLEVAPPGALLSSLSPSRLAHLALPALDLGAQHALMLTDFPHLTSLDMRLDAGSAGVPPILSRLTQLQRLQLGGSCSGLHWTDLQPLTGLTHLAFKCTSFRHLSNLTALMQLRHLQVDVTLGSGPRNLPTPASFAGLQSYRFSSCFLPRGIQLVGFRFTRLSLEPFQPTTIELSAADAQPVDAQPVSLCVSGEGLQNLQGLELLLGLDGNAEEGGQGELEAALLGAAAGVGMLGAAPGGGLLGALPGAGLLGAAGGAGGAAAQPPAPQLGALLEAAVPPHCTLRRLVLAGYDLDTTALQRLPVLPQLHCLELRSCWSTSTAGGARGTDSTDAFLRALAQLAPGLTQLYCAPTGRLRSWPAYLLAHPSLRSLTVLNHDPAQWNDEEAHLHLSTAGEPVLEELTTDCLTSLPPQLAAAASLRSLTLTNARFELAISAIDTLLALPHLACLTLPRRLSEAGWQAVQQLRRARPGLSVECSADCLANDIL